jgi:GxxExxY protein
MQNRVPSSGDSRTFSIIGAAMEVHRTLGCGFLEVFYRDALAIEFGLRSIPFDSEVACGVDYKGHLLRGHYRIDFVCYTEVIVEVKARTSTGPGDEAQVLNYLAATGHQVALLLNFGGSRLDYRRFVLTKPQAQDA